MSTMEMGIRWRIYIMNSWPVPLSGIHVFYPFSFHHQSSAPELNFPMDAVTGNLLFGSMAGTLLGNARVEPGMYGNALYIDGQTGSRVDYGAHKDGCFFDPDQCIEGITFSFWLMIHEDEAVFDIIFDSGGCRAMSVGYCVILKTGKTIEVRVLRRAGYRKHVLPSTPIRQWHSWLVTHTSSDISVYINGCNTVPFAIESDSPRVAAHTEDADFHIGDWSGGGLAPHMTIDELMIWYKVLTVDQIWQLYVQGGMVWNTMMSLDGSIFHVTALYWRGDPTVTGGSHNITKANEMDLWWFHWFAPEKKTVGQ